MSQYLDALIVDIFVEAFFRLLCISLGWPHDRKEPQQGRAKSASVLHLMNDLMIINNGMM